jgi:hypothetical protein
MYLIQSLLAKILRKAIGLHTVVAVLFAATIGSVGNSDAVGGPTVPNGCGDWVNPTIEDLPGNFPNVRPMWPSGLARR